MSYQAPYVDETGYHYPTYEEILDDIITRFQEIYGDGIYLGADSQDYQIISIFALKIFDAFQAVELAYNAHSPVTAIGTALDAIVALNGITRAQGTKSMVQVTLSGIAGTVINNGIVSDIEGRLWDLPATVTLDGGGAATVTATCRETGVVTAEIGAVSRIMTPTLGWVSVTNNTAATAGKYTESDSSLRARQVTSVAMPSQTILSGLRGALLALDGVVNAEVYENDTNAAYGEGHPLEGITAHSICAVVDFDATDTDLKAQIAKTILMYKSCGCATYKVSGSDYGISESVIDDATGETYTINYQQVQHVDVDVSVTIAPAQNYSQAYKAKIEVALRDYLNSLNAGQSISTSMLAAVIMNVNESLTNPAFTVSSVTAQREDAASLSFAFYEMAHGGEITINDGTGGGGA